MGSRSMNNTTTDDSGLIVRQNEDGTFELEWDEKDSRWSWLNGMSNEEVKIILQDAIKNSMEELTTK
jgi:hypothetical protein